MKDYGKLPLVTVDEARLGQVFINLIVNAAQSFSAEMADANEIRIVTSTDAEGRAVVEVRDDGIFDPFFTTKPVGIGTGLGLSISHNIVTGLGGTLSVESSVGRGTTMRVVLPPCKPLEPRAAPNRSSTPHVASGVRALVVDDEPAIGMAFKRILRGHAVTTVTAAHEVLALLAAGNDYDVIFSDLMMPGVSGMELYKTIAKLHPTMAPRVVFVTGGAFTVEANAFLDQVPNERLEKPFTVSAILETVQKFERRV